MDDDWAFRVTIKNHEYKIWANGQIAGFPLCGGAVVVNKIPRIVADAHEAGHRAACSVTAHRERALCGRISELESQLEAEGAHTAAANETIDRLQRWRP